MVEMALILPLFALFLVITIDFGRVFFTHIQVTNAAREAAAYGATVPGDDAGIALRALQEQNAQSQGGESAIDVDVQCQDAMGSPLACADAASGSGPGNTMTVTVAEDFTFLTPLVDSFLGDFTLSASATSTVLGYAAGPGGPPATGCVAPTASFTVIITVDLSIHVDPAASSPNNGICSISGFFWDWGDSSEDTVGSATGDDHTYALPGTYMVRLEVTNQAGSGFATVNVTVPEGAAPTCDVPIAHFNLVSHNQTGGSGNAREYTYVFKDTSTVADPVNCPITAWRWMFEDGTESNAPNPTHVYVGKNNVTFETTLIVTNAGGDSASYSFEP